MNEKRENNEFIRFGRAGNLRLPYLSTPYFKPRGEYIRFGKKKREIGSILKRAEERGGNDFIRFGKKTREVGPNLKRAEERGGNDFIRFGKRQESNALMPFGKGFVDENGYGFMVLGNQVKKNILSRKNQGITGNLFQL